MELNIICLAYNKYPSAVIGLINDEINDKYLLTYMLKMNQNILEKVIIIIFHVCHK